jgi:hypothetical protein
MTRPLHTFIGGAPPPLRPYAPANSAGRVRQRGHAEKVRLADVCPIVRQSWLIENPRMTAADTTTCPGARS